MSILRLDDAFAGIYHSSQRLLKTRMASAMTMAAFAAGTLPLMLGLGARARVRRLVDGGGSRAGGDLLARLELRASRDARSMSTSAAVQRMPEHVSSSIVGA